MTHKNGDGVLNDTWKWHTLEWHSIMTLENGNTLWWVYCYSHF